MNRYALSGFGWVMFLVGVVCVIAASFVVGLLLMMVGVVIQPAQRDA